ncbi:MAG: hypothetical protein JM58_07480 [Peptococcaceae bacterium BICA1-8]|nr:MAG: hypothetical protein JM58_07480 [Peptococcaceae bacterium BICA1-8]
MFARRILINNIEVKSILDLFRSNHGSLYYTEKDAEDFCPFKEENCTMVPIQLLVSMFGFTLKWDDYGEGFSIKRGNKEIKFRRDKYLLNGKEVAFPTLLQEDATTKVPLKIFTQAFGIKGEWVDEETLSLIDSVTLPYYLTFNQVKYSIDKINQVFLFDLDADGNEEMYVAYYNDNQLSLSGVNLQGDWLYDDFLQGRYVFDIGTVQIGSKKALAVITPGGVQITTIYLFMLEKGCLINLEKFEPPGNGELVNDEIQITYRSYDTADHGFKVKYSWCENLGRFVENKKEVFYWFDANQVDPKRAESVVYGFCEAISLSLEEEALSYCSKKIRFAFGKEGLGYSVKHPTIDIRRMIDHYRENCTENTVLQVQEQSSSEDKKLFLAFYGDCQVYRLVLQRIEENWEIINLNFLYNQFPAQIRFSSDLNFRAVYPIFSLFTCFSLDSESFVNIKLATRYPDYQEISSCYIDRSSTVELVELFPGVQLSFFRDGWRLCYFTLEDAQDVEIDMVDCDISIVVTLAYPRLS